MWNNTSNTERKWRDSLQKVTDIIEEISNRGAVVSSMSPPTSMHDTSQIIELVETEVKFATKMKTSLLSAMNNLEIASLALPHRVTEPHHSRIMTLGARVVSSLSSILDNLDEMQSLVDNIPTKNVSTLTPRYRSIPDVSQMASIQRRAEQATTDLFDRVMNR